MPGLKAFEGKTAVYDADNVDTDRIIPARFLSRVERGGYGELLFVDARAADPAFPLDLPAARSANVLVTGTNFGCGSSREHAVWAIQQAGFLAVVARSGEGVPGFSDIFRQNAANCGLLLIELGAQAHAAVVKLGSGARLDVDLPGQVVRLGPAEFGFQIDPVSKDQILRGLDLVGTTLDSDAAILAFEARWDSFAPAK